MDPLLTTPEIETPNPAPAPDEYGTNGHAESAIVRITRLLWSERRYLMKVSALGLLFATTVALLIPARYTAVVQLMPPDSSSSSSMLAAAAVSKLGMMAGPLIDNVLGGKSTSQLLVGVLESRTIADRLINQFDLRKVYWVSRWVDARKILARRTAITNDRKTGIVTVEVTDKSPERAAALATAYVTELNNLMSTLNTSAAHRQRVFLEERLKGVTAELEAAEIEFSEFASTNTAIDMKEQGKSMVDAMAKVEGQLVAAQAQLEGLRQIFGEDHVQVRGARARIAVLKNQLQKMGGSPGGEDANALFPPLRKLPVLGVKYADLYRHAKVEEAIFETLTQHYELAKVEEAKEIPSIKVLDAATIPEKKSFPPRILIIAFGTLLAFCGACAWVVGLTEWGKTTDEDEVKKLVIDIATDLDRSNAWFIRGAKHLLGRNGRKPYVGSQENDAENVPD